MSKYDDYKIAVFGTVDPSAKNLDDAFTIAQENRQKEIDRRQQRVSFFWTIESLILTVIGFMWLKHKDAYALIFIASLVGLFATFIWAYLSKASHFWQHNYEQHVDILSEIIGVRVHLVNLTTGTTKRYSLGKIQTCIVLVIASLLVLSLTVVSVEIINNYKLMSQWLLWVLLFITFASFSVYLYKMIDKFVTPKQDSGNVYMKERVITKVIAKE